MLLSKIRTKTTLIMYIFLALFAVGGVYGLFGTGGNAFKTDQKQKTLDKLADVDGTPITASDFDFVYMRAIQMIEQRGTRVPDDYDTRMYLRFQVLQQMVNDELVRREGKRLGISVSSSELNTTIRKERDMRVGYMQKSEDSSIQGRVRALFSDQNRNKEFSKQILQMGMTMGSYKAYVRQQLYDDKTKKAIVASMRKGAEEAVVKRADEVLKKLQAGEDFGVLAAQYSEDETSKSAGGDVGWINRGMMEPELETAAFSMQPGQISSLIKTASGIFIIQALEKKVANGPEFEADKPRLSAEISKLRNIPASKVTEDELKSGYEKVHFRAIKLALESEQQVLGKWLSEKRKTARVRILDPEVNAFAYSMGFNLNSGEQKPDPKHTLDLYKEALAMNSNNEFIYLKMGSIYEKMADEAAGKASDDPYASAGDFSGKGNKKSRGLYKQALENYIQAYQISDRNKRYDFNIYIGVARTSLSTGDKAQAKKFFEEAIMFAADDMKKLEAVKKGLEEVHSSPKKIKEVEDMMAELEKAKSEEAATEKKLEEQSGAETASGTQSVPAESATATKAVPPATEKPQAAKPAAPAKPAPAVSKSGRSAHTVEVKKPVAAPAATENKPTPAAPAPTPAPAQ